MGEIHILELFKQSFTLVIMLFCSILSITFALERWWYFRTAQSTPDEVLGHVRKNLESGKGSTVHSLAQALRVLDKLDWLRALAPVVSISPVQMLKAKAPRQRASRKRKTPPPA